MNKIKAIIFDYFGVIEVDGKLNSGILDVVKSLKDKGYKTAVLSNANSLVREKMDKEGIEQYFDALVFSGDIGHQKPDPIIFKALYEKLEVHPEESVFIDDMHEALSSSHIVGYTPLLYTNNEETIKKLEELLEKDLI